MIDDLFYVCFDWMESRFAGRGTGTCMPVEEVEDEYERRVGVLLTEKVKACRYGGGFFTTPT